MTETICTVRYAKEGAYFVFPFSGPFIYALKATIPKEHRRWDPENRWWVVGPSFAGEAVLLAREHFGVVECFGRKPRGRRLPSAEISVSLEAPAADQARVAYLQKQIATLEENLARLLERHRRLEEDRAKLTEENGQLEAYVQAVTRENESLRAQDDIPPNYRTLCLLPTAPPEVVRAAYRALALLYHPDRSRAPDATERMKAINAAYGHICRTAH